MCIRDRWSRYAAVLDPDGYLPLRLTGAVSSPSVGMPKAEDLIQGAVGGALNNLLGGKKDKDGKKKKFNPLDLLGGNKKKKDDEKKKEDEKKKKKKNPLERLLGGGRR